MSVINKITNDIREAMRARDSLKKDTLRMLLSELKYAQLASSYSKKEEATEQEEIKCIAGYQKKLVKSAKDYPPGEQKEKILKEIAIVESYLPKKASVEEVDQIIAAVFAETEDRTFGILMKKTLEKLGALADGKLVSERIKEKLKS